METGWLAAGAGVVLLVVIMGVDTTLGQAGISLTTIVKALLRPDESIEHAIVLHVRLPRIAAGLIAGAALGISGAVFQSVTRNPLASPGILGVNAGAFLTLTMSLLLWPGLVPPIVAAFVGGVLATLLVYAIAGGISAPPLRLALAGVATTLALGSVAAAIALLHEEGASGLYFWGAGSLDQAGWGGPLYALPYALAAGISAFLLARPLDLLALGDDAARVLGQRVQTTRAVAITLATLLAAAAVCVAGPISFIGLVAPNALRLVGIRRHAVLLPAAAVWGAVLLLIADVGAQLATLGNTLVPAGVVAAIIGAPVLLLLIRHIGRGRHSGPGASARTAAGGSRRRAHFGALTFGLIAALVVILVAGVASGQLTFTPAEIWEVLAGRGGPLARSFILELRLPRMLVAFAAGTMLGVSGLLLQGIIRNPLASPELVGVSQGAGLAALIILIAIPSASGPVLQSGAFAGGLAVLVLVYATSQGTDLTPARMALTGLAVAAFCAAISNLLVIGADLQSARALVWLAGTTYARGWSDFFSIMPWLLALIPLAWASARWLDLAALGEDPPQTLGLALMRTRALVLLLAIALAAAAVATVGTVAFVGLAAPHVARLIAGASHRRLVPVAALCGALMLGAADIAGRLILAPKEIPVGLVTAIVGAPYLLLLLWRSRRTV